MRVIFPLLAAAALSSAATSTFDLAWDYKAVEFERHWDITVRQAFGCLPVGDTTKETCNLSRGTMNVKEWEASRKAAMKLFDLREP